jgi:hypothetical protein
MNFVIYNPDEKLFWSNVDGWVNIHTATYFTTPELISYNLPIGGSWVQRNIAGLLPIKEE